MTNIIQTGDKILRETAKEIALTEIKTPKIKRIFEENDHRSFKSQRRRGFGGATNRPTASNIYRMQNLHRPKNYAENGGERKMAGKNCRPQNLALMFFINPKITKISKKKQTVKEGCLSVTGVFGIIARAEKSDRGSL